MNCPKCGHEMFEIAGMFECIHPDCDNFEKYYGDLKAPDCSDEIREGVVNVEEANANGKEDFSIC